MVDAGAAVLQRKSGLVMPATMTDLSKRSRTMARQKFLKILRHMKFAREYGLATHFVCTTCKTPVKLTRGEAATLIQTDGADNTIDPRTDKFSMACSCSVWTVK